MLPVSAWPPGPPGASLSPFGQPRQVKVCGNGFVIPKGAWIVATGSNCVKMFYPPVQRFPAQRTLGTGLLPGSIPPQRTTMCGCPPKPCGPPTFRKFNDEVEAFRAWQRATGQTDPPLRSFAGRRPPNWFGWKLVPAPSSTLVPSGASGLVIADGQNVVITGSGCATITQAYSV
jgi:hypothetical protein|nr:hypothetical protein [Bradyrhizobium sp.]